MTLFTAPSLSPPINSGDPRCSSALLPAWSSTRHWRKCQKMESHRCPSSKPCKVGKGIQKTRLLVLRKVFNVLKTKMNLQWERSFQATLPTVKEERPGNIQPLRGDQKATKEHTHGFPTSPIPNQNSEKLMEQNIVPLEGDFGDQVQVSPVPALSDQLQEGDRMTTNSLCDTDFFIQKHEVKPCPVQRGHSPFPLCPAPDSQNP